MARRPPVEPRFLLDPFEPAYLASDVRTGLEERVAAAGAERWFRSYDASWRPAANLLVISTAAAAGGWAAGFLRFAKPSFSYSIASAGGLGILIAGLWLLKIFSRHRPAVRRIVPGAAVVLVALDLIAAGSGLVPTASPDLYRAAEPSAAETAERLGLFLQIGFELRYSHLYTKIQEWADAGLLGDIVNTHCLYCSSAYEKDAWRNRMDEGGSTFGERLSHYVDLTRWWIGVPVVDVFSACAPNVIPYTQVRDNYHTTYRFQNGAISPVSAHRSRRRLPSICRRSRLVLW